MILSLLLACKATSPATPPETAAPVVSSVLEQTLQNHAVYSAELWGRTLQAARTMDRKIQQFTTELTPETLEGVQEAWKNARQVYSQTEALRFQNGPIDNAETGLESYLNGWPVDEVYIDYIQDDSAAGIINKTEAYPEITKELLLSLNEKGGEENISLGYHAIEFLLWGQDLKTDSAGQRPISDFTDHPNAKRRITYLQVSSGVLLEHLNQIHEAWTGEYKDKFLAMDDQSRVKGIWTGMAMLAGDEMAGERMAVAYETRSQEDEQSCFSDNTLQDFKNNLIGIANIYAGTDRRSFAALIAEKDQELHNKLLNNLSEAFTALLQIPEPFDQSILSEDTRPQVERAITSLENLSNTLVEGAAALGVTVNLEGG
jgi:putative iron-regulated protein